MQQVLARKTLEKQSPPGDQWQFVNPSHTRRGATDERYRVDGRHGGANHAGVHIRPFAVHTVDLRLPELHLDLEAGLSFDLHHVAVFDKPIRFERPSDLVDYV